MSNTPAAANAFERGANVVNFQRGSIQLTPLVTSGFVSDPISVPRGMMRRTFWGVWLATGVATNYHKGVIQLIRSNQIVAEIPWDFGLNNLSEETFRLNAHTTATSCYDALQIYSVSGTGYYSAPFYVNADIDTVRFYSRSTSIAAANYVSYAYAVRSDLP